MDKKMKYNEKWAPYNLHRWSPRKDETALLVIDMQNYFRELAKEILPPLKSFIEECRENQIPVIYTAHGHIDPEKDGGILKEWWEDLIIFGSYEHKLIAEIAPKEGEKIIAKKRYSAFYKTDLEAYLRGLGIKDVIISGVMTNLCCETTAREAFERDFRVFFLADGTATADQELHTSSLINLAFGFATIYTFEEIREKLGFNTKESRGGEI